MEVKVSESSIELERVKKLVEKVKERKNVQRMHKMRRNCWI